MTTSFIYENSSLLLAMKKRGFGEGRWNGYGGKVKPGETIEETAIRETDEEIGLKVRELEKRGVIDFIFEDRPNEILEVHFFRVKNYSGEPIETEEMRPQWFHVDNIPLDKMWPDDKYWLPLFMGGKKFKGKFIFEGQDKILDYKLELI